MRIRPLVGALAAAMLAACSESPTGPSTPTPPRGIVVLNGFGQQGVTLLGDTGSTTARLDFGASFDGGGMAVQRDTVLATSSRFGGDQLYVASIAAGTVTRVQLPAASNPGSAAFTGGLGNAAVAVALRDARALALVRTGTSPTVSTIAGVGRCPYGVGVQGNSFWVLDANLACEASYAPQGDSRLIRVAPDGAGARDTIVLAGVRNATAIVVTGNVAFVSSGGLADFSAFPGVTWSAPSRIVKVDLATRRVVSTLTVAPVSNGGGVRLGADGRLYMTVYTATDYSTTEVFAFDQDLNPAGTRTAGKNSLALRLANGTAPKCQGAVADALGRVYCPVNGTGSAATLHVFDAAGALLRSIAVGQGAVDVALR